MKIWEPLTLLTICAALLIGLAIWIVLRLRQSPQERERKRRLDVNLRGRLADALITEIQDGSIYYSYTIRGVEYHTSQDVSTLRQYLPEDTERLIGPATLKYSTANPANSIIMCEEWAGFRTRNLRSA
jgi:hypothetical protein